MIFAYQKNVIVRRNAPSCIVYVTFHYLLAVRKDE